jgi:interleukin enhancer-binding factor 2
MARPQNFDQFMNELEYPRMVSDEVLSNALLARNQKITPTEKEQEIINNLVSRTKIALEQIAAEDSTTAKIEEIREVGSYRKGTMVARNNVADLVIIFKGPPKRKSIYTLCVVY